ncbi:acyl carrier protein [Luteimonas sp. RIT-PG2_3]|jgi:acyl carrier protein
MDKQSIMHRLQEMLNERVDVTVPLTGETTIQQLGIDSIILVDFMLDLESELNFTFKSMDLAKDANLDQIVDLVYDSLGPAA